MNLISSIFFYLTPGVINIIHPLVPPPLRKEGEVLGRGAAPLFHAPFYIRQTAYLLTHC